MTDLRIPSILTSGYIALDVVQAPAGTWLRAGGTAANVAATLSWFGWHAAIVGLLGMDDAGPIVERDLRTAGVDTTGLRLRSDVGTPLILHQIAPSGHQFKFGCAACGRRYQRHRPLAVRDLDQVLSSDAKADVLFFDRPTASALELASAYRRDGRLVVYEPSSAGRPSAHRRASELANIIKFSQERLPLFGDSLGAPRDGQLWIITAGEAGTRYRIGTEPWRTVDAFHVGALDAGGAGDWMSAALLTQIVSMTDWSESAIQSAIRHAQAVAAVSCLVPGARTLSDVLSLEELIAEVARLLAGGTPRLSFRRGPQVIGED